MGGFGTVIVGLGHCGVRLHVPVLRRLRHTGHPLIGYDRRSRPAPPDVTVVRRLPDLTRLTDPTHSVVHLCTPPNARAEPLEALARLGFRKFLVEKPLAGDERELAVLDRLRETHDLDIVVIAQWLTSTLGARLTAAGSGGDLRSITITQHKPRFARSLGADGHASALDVEVPHALGLALRIAGPGRVDAARCDDLVCGATRVPGMGGAWLSIEHDRGVHTEIHSDLTSPIRERRVTLDIGDGSVVGHFPVSADDPYSQLWTTDREVFHDDALESFFRRAYTHFSGGERLETLSLGRDVVRLLGQAKRVASAVPV